MLYLKLRKYKDMSKQKKIQEYCDKVNALLENKDAKGFVDVINDMIHVLNDTALYWSRSVYIACNCDYEDCWESIKTYPELFKCVISDDMDEHPGLTIRFKDKKYDDRW